MDIIKCHVCKLDNETCNQRCVELDDVSELYVEGITDESQVLNRFCTAHKCSNNPSGFRCEVEYCSFRRIITTRLAGGNDK